MASDPRTVQYIVEQMGEAGEIRSRAMFGGHGVYCNDRFVAIIGDDELFVKDSPAGQQFLDPSHLAPPYPGANNAFRVPPERWEDREWLGTFVRATAEALPPPQPRRAKRAPAS